LRWQDITSDSARRETVDVWKTFDSSGAPAPPHSRASTPINRRVPRIARAEPAQHSLHVAPALPEQGHLRRGGPRACITRHSRGGGGWRALNHQLAHQRRGRCKGRCKGHHKAVGGGLQRPCHRQVAQRRPRPKRRPTRASSLPPGSWGSKAPVPIAGARGCRAAVTQRLYRRVAAGLSAARTRRGTGRFSVYQLTSLRPSGVIGGDAGLAQATTPLPLPAKSLAETRRAAAAGQPVPRTRRGPPASSGACRGARQSGKKASGPGGTRGSKARRLEVR
jgi:hypothetical protein